MRPLEVKIPLTVYEDHTLNLKVNDDSIINLKVENYTGGGGGDYPIYDGPTRVTPLVHESISLPTKNTSVLSNIVVGEIPYYETSNEKGKTFIIGG